MSERDGDKNEREGVGEVEGRSRDARERKIRRLINRELNVDNSNHRRQA
jgi:hypothetical protein